MRTLAFIAASTLVACGSGAPTGPRPSRIERAPIAGLRIDGLSGLALDGDGVPIAVPERGAALVELGPRGARAIPLDGVPGGVETESIAWLGGERFALGTESMDVERTADAILIVERGPARARVVEHVTLPYSILGVRAEENHGIEGLCFAPGEGGGTLIAAMENVVSRGGARWAPLGVREGDGAFRRVLARLGSETGKLSALDCRRRGDAIEVLAIERHFGVMRIVRFDLPPSADRVTPRVVYDLAGRLEGDPNLEGIARAGDELLLLVDNHYGTRQGPNELVRVPLPP